ncbi:MAG: hypothetical protein RMY64_33910 [Nostoc sp. DedQUE08]|uniref:hypothetical protein n=1 Tax=unclassified Nostoc TaxID=2593658 RepID=UPI002AD3E722|nr:MULTISPECIES: hypothetical protein [unclassified Nostoc]MDZ8070551.1 hypothetical protein [Nostoc sp. DedQUE08]MDZ8096752.1 hypothetical protein [Nostoc sp. DedQUE05]MDZ8128953.1 hypothetical protein [Nostoc sp. DedQUE07]
MNKFKYFSILFLSIVLMDGATIKISAQAAGTKVLVTAQNESLNKSDIDKVIAFYEWVFSGKFTSEQRNEYQSIKLNEFRKDPDGTRKSIDNLISNYTQALAKTEEEQSRIRQAFNGEFVGQLRNLPNDAEAKLLLSVYDSAHAGETASNDTDDSSGSVGEISSLVGKWVWTRTGNSAISTNGTYIGSNGSRFTYQFLPNGTVEFTGIMNVMNGSCNQQIFQSRKGKASLSGSTMTLNWSPATFTRDFSCDRANNYTKTLPAENETYQVKFKTDLGQKQLCLIGKDETCFSPTN